MAQGRSSERQLAAVAAWTLLVVLALVAVVLVLRRLSGALIQPLGLGGLAAVAVPGFVMATVIRQSLCRPHFVLGTKYSVLRKDFVIYFAVTAILFLILAAVTLPGTPAAGVVAAWFLVVASEAAAWQQAAGRRARRTAIAPSHDEPEGAPELPANLLQQVTRVQDEGGGESVHAVLRAVVPAGDRQGAIHVSFCPPLLQAPQLVAHALGGEADVRITQAESFGARLEVRLPASAAADQAVLVEVIGSVTAGQSA